MTPPTGVHWFNDTPVFGLERVAVAGEDAGGEAGRLLEPALDAGEGVWLDPPSANTPIGPATA